MANRDARAALTQPECGACTDLDHISAKKPAKLLDSKSLTLGFSLKQIWPVFLPVPEMWASRRRPQCIGQGLRTNRTSGSNPIHPELRLPGDWDSSFFTQPAADESDAVFARLPTSGPARGASPAAARRACPSA